MAKLGHGRSSRHVSGGEVACSSGAVDKGEGRWSSRPISARRFVHSSDPEWRCKRCTCRENERVVIRPEPRIAFCSIFVHPFFPVFEPHIQKWVIFVRRRPCVCDTFRFESLSPWKKDRFWHRFPPPSPSAGLRQLNFPFVKNDAGQKQYSPCFLRRRHRPKATPSQEYGCPKVGV